MREPTPPEDDLGPGLPAEPPRRRRRWLRVAVLGALAAAAVAYGVLPTVVSARSDIDILRTASVLFLAAGLVLEVASWAAYTAFTRAVLPPGLAVTWPTQFAIDLTGYGASHVLPGGGAAAMALRYRLMTRAGLPRGTVVGTAATQTVLADVALAACYLVGAVLSLEPVMERPALQLTAAVGVLLVGGAVVAGVYLVSGSDRLARVRAAESRIGAWLQPRLAYIGRELTIFLRSGSRTVRACGFASANWLLDAACLYLCLASFSGSHPGPALVLTAYGFANLLGLLPVTPGGLGVVEGSLIPLLIALGASAPVAVLGVVTWRVLQFWLPVPLAAACYLWLRVTRRLASLPPDAADAADEGRGTPRWPTWSSERR